MVWSASDEAGLRERGHLKPLFVDHDGNVERRWMCWPPPAGIPYQVIDEDVDADGRALSIYEIGFR